jgi:hypothetical protein
MDIRHVVGVKAGVPAGKAANLSAIGVTLQRAGAAVLEFCERTTRDDLEVTDERLMRVRAHFRERELAEPMFIAGFQIFAIEFERHFVSHRKAFPPSARGCLHAPREVGLS